MISKLAIFSKYRSSFYLNHWCRKSKQLTAIHSRMAKIHQLVETRSSGQVW